LWASLHFQSATIIKFYNYLKISLCQSACDGMCNLLVIFSSCHHIFLFWRRNFKTQSFFKNSCFTQIYFFLLLSCCTVTYVVQTTQTYNAWCTILDECVPAIVRTCFLETQYKRRYSYMFGHLSLWIYTCISYPYEHLQKTEPAWSLRFTKLATKSVSLSTGMSSPTKRIISHKCNTYIKFMIWTWVS
jgi:hypothetical protein